MHDRNKYNANTKRGNQGTKLCSQSYAKLSQECLKIYQYYYITTSYRVRHDEHWSKLSNQKFTYRNHILIRMVSQHRKFVMLPDIVKSNFAMNIFKNLLILTKLQCSMHTAYVFQYCFSHYKNKQMKIHFCYIF